MAFPSSADIDTTKLDNDNDSIKDSRAELHKMAGYVNDIITEGPASLGSNSNSIGAADSNPVQFFANTTQASKGLELYARSFSTSSPALTLNSDSTITLAASNVFMNSPLKVFNRTTAQRDSIANIEDGMIIYNTSTNKFQGRANGVWVDLH